MGYGLTIQIGSTEVDKDGKLKFPNIAHLSMCYTQFECPHCEYKYDVEWYEKQLQKSKNQLIYKACKICKKKIGITYDMMGDVTVWLKEKE